MEKPRITAKIAGRPLHPLLRPFVIGYFFAVCGCDLVYSQASVVLGEDAGLRIDEVAAADGEEIADHEGPKQRVQRTAGDLRRDTRFFHLTTKPPDNDQRASGAARSHMKAIEQERGRADCDSWPPTLVGAISGGRFYFRREIVRAMPPRIAADATSSRGLIASESSATPPNAAMAGTLSCTVAAEVALRAGSAAYHST